MCFERMPKSKASFVKVLIILLYNALCNGLQKDISDFKFLELGNEPRDVSRCGALSLLQKPLHLRGINLNSCPDAAYVGLGPVVNRARVLIHEVINCSAQAVVRGGARFVLQVLDSDGNAQTDARGAAQVLERCAQAVALGAAR
jgi:hypothetical protein